MSELKIEVYKAIFETWRYEVDSYWVRNNYFAAFETAALAGCWYVVEHHHLWVGLAFSLLGLVSALIWRITSEGVHNYVAYWWKSIHEAENKLSLGAEGLDYATKHTGSGRPLGQRPSRMVLFIPVLFMLAWVVIAAFAIHCLCPCNACPAGTP